MREEDQEKTGGGGEARPAKRITSNAPANFKNSVAKVVVAKKTETDVEEKEDCGYFIQTVRIEWR